MIRTRLLFSLVAFALVLGGTPLSAQDRQPPTKPADKENPETVLLQSVGLLSALQLYQTYLNIGFLADGRSVGLYDDDEARQILTSILVPLEAIDQQMARIAALATTKSDREALEQLRRINALLRDQGKVLLTYWQTNKKEHGEQYETLRKEAWTTLSGLLGLKK